MGARLRPCLDDCQRLSMEVCFPGAPRLQRLFGGPHDVIRDAPDFGRGLHILDEGFLNEAGTASFWLRCGRRCSRSIRSSSVTERRRDGDGRSVLRRSCCARWARLECPPLGHRVALRRRALDPSIPALHRHPRHFTHAGHPRLLPNRARLAGQVLYRSHRPPRRSMFLI